MKVRNSEFFEDYAVFQVVVNDPRFFQLFREHGNPKKSEVKLKKPNQLNQVLNLARAILSEKQVKSIFPEKKSIQYLRSFYG